MRTAAPFTSSPAARGGKRPPAGRGPGRPPAPPAGAWPAARQGPLWGAVLAQPEKRPHPQHPPEPEPRAPQGQILRPVVLDLPEVPHGKAAPLQQGEGLLGVVFQDGLLHHPPRLVVLDYREDSPRPQKPGKLPEDLSPLGDVFQHVVAQDAVKASPLQGGQPLGPAHQLPVGPPAHPQGQKVPVGLHSRHLVALPQVGGGDAKTAAKVQQPRPFPGGQLPPHLPVKQLAPGFLGVLKIDLHVPVHSQRLLFPQHTTARGKIPPGNPPPQPPRLSLQKNIPRPLDSQQGL